MLAALKRLALVMVMASFAGAGVCRGRHSHLAK
jgi:hypothetical protein